MIFDWRKLGIATYGRQSGELKTLCPKCSAGRTHKNDKCLSVNLTTGVFNCHHCEWSGKAEQIGGRSSQHWEKPRKVYRKPEYQPATEPPADKLVDWFAKRGIPAEVIRRNQIESRSAWMPQTNKDERAIAFPYFRDGEIVNVKYRTADKMFRMEKDAEPCLYGLDDIEDFDSLVIVEGEIDKLSLEVAGFPNCVSVPNGADSDLDCLAADAERLAHIRKFIIAVDTDEKGEKLKQKLISRLGRDRCWLVEWPFGCKDANEVLTEHNADKVRECIESAKPIPIEGLFEIDDIREQVKTLWKYGSPRGVDVGWASLNKLYRPRLGAWTAIISIPKAGKTAFMAAMMINLAKLHGWRFAVFPAENLPAEEYASMLAEIYIGKPFSEGYHERMSEAQLDQALDWLQEHFVILSPNDDERDLDSILSIGKAYCLRRGIHGLVIDPFNELDLVQPQGVTETQFTARCLIKVRQFAKTHNVHVWISIHPTKLQKDKDGNYPVPTLYDASGSAHWRNKCDYGISIYRHYNDPDKPTEIHVQAVRWKGTGEIGVAELYFDRVTGRYSEQPTEWKIAEPRSKYRDSRFGEYLSEIEGTREF